MKTLEAISGTFAGDASLQCANFNVVTQQVIWQRRPRRSLCRRIPRSQGNSQTVNLTVAVAP